MTARRASVLAFLVCWIWLPSAQGVRYSIDRLPHLDGVIVRGTVQDSHGFLWLATDNGLLRWDGTEFRRLTDAVDFSGPVHALAEDSGGTLLAATENGIYGIDVATLQPHPDAPWLRGHSIRQLAVDPSGDLWAGGFPGLYRLRRVTDTYDLVPNEAPFADSKDMSVYSLRRHRDGTIWVGTQRGVYCFRDNQFRRLLEDAIPDGHVTAVTFTGDGATWLGTREPGRLLRLEGETIRNFTIEDGLGSTDANVIVEHPNGEVWVGTERGVIRWDGDRFTSIDRSHGLVNDDIHALCVDREQQVWIGTFGAGAYLLRSAHVVTYGMEDGLPHTAITSITQTTDGALFVGTVNGVARFDPAAGTAKSVRDNTNAHAVYTDSQGTAWLSDQNGVIRLSDGQTFHPAHGTCLGEDASGRVIVGTGSAVEQPTLGEEPKLVAVISDTMVSALLASREGDLLVGTDRGLVRVRGAAQELVLDGVAISAMMYDARGRLILGTSRGLGWLNRGTLECFDQYVPLRFTTHDLLLDHRGHIWAATDVGVLSVEPGGIRRIGRADGLPSEDVRAIVETSPGVLFAGTTQGLARLDTEKLEVRSQVPTLQITQMTAGGHPVDFRNPDLTLTHAHQEVTIWTHLVGWRSAENARTQFRLIGADDAWSDPSEASYFFYPDLAPGNYTLLARAVHEHGMVGEPVSVSFKVLRPYWQSAWFVASVAVLLFGVVGLSGRLLARRRQLRQAAAAAVRARSEFVSRMSHEIRTPLTVILACAETLSDEELPPATRSACIDTVLRNGRHLLGVVSDVLDLSKINSDEMEIELIPCDLTELLREVEAIAAHKAADKPIDVRVRIDETTPTHVVTDPTRLRQILINLLDNAIKFTDEGFVRLRVTWHGDAGGHQGIVTFTVMDTGHGITPEKQAVVFGAFRQEDSSITRRYGGTGLGLTIAKSLTELLGGSLTLHTEPGAGTSFVLELPVRIDEPALHDDRAAIAPSPRPVVDLGGARVLIADDCDDLRRVTEIILERAGARPVCVADGNGAIQLACRETYDAILLDIHMPMLDGVSALKELRRRGVDVPCLAISADATEETQQRCRQSGFDGFMAKPFDRETLVAAVHRVIHSTGADEHTDFPPPGAGAPCESLDLDHDGPIYSELASQSPRLADAVAEFVSALERDIDRLEQALAQDDTETIHDIAHRLKGSGGINGYACVSDAAGRLGRCVAQNELADAAGHIATLRSLHRRMQAGFATATRS